MGISEFLQSSPSLRLALQGDDRYSRDFEYTASDFKYIRDNTETIFFQLVKRNREYHDLSILVCSSESVRSQCIATFNLTPPPFASIEEEGTYLIPYVRKLLVSLVVVFGFRTATTFLTSSAMTPSQVAIACTSAASWIESIDTLPPREVQDLQVSAIANFVTHLAYCNFPTSVYRGVFYYLAATDISDSEVEEEILPRIATNRRTNKATTFH